MIASLRSTELDMGNYKKSLQIIKLKDEWYYVLNTNYIGKYYHLAETKMYKCDQWQGLINCLNRISKERFTPNISIT